MKTYTDASTRHEFVLLFDVINGNPNGDPDAGNLPRFDHETMQGLVTDVALKRKIRDYVALVAEQPIFIQSKVSLNSLILQAYVETGYNPAQVDLSEDEVANDLLMEWLEDKSEIGISVEGSKLLYAGEAKGASQIGSLLADGTDEQALLESLRPVARKIANALKSQSAQPSREQQEDARQRLCSKYYDIRMFGAVLSTGLNAGQVRGPVQFTFAKSIDPVLQMDLSITRQARTTTPRMATGKTEMGRKPIIAYGLYRAHGYFNPFHAKQTGVSDEDLELLWDATRSMFENDRSAARGDMNVQGLWVFTHDDAKGNAPAHRLFQTIKVARKGEVAHPRSFDAYEIAAPTEGKLADYEGVSVTKLV